MAPEACGLATKLEEFVDALRQVQSTGGPDVQEMCVTAFYHAVKIGEAITTAGCGPVDIVVRGDVPATPPPPPPCKKPKPKKKRYRSKLPKDGPINFTGWLQP
jgi:hypothetical protein